MPATIQRIHGLNMISVPGLPPVSISQEEMRIAALPGLVHFLEPERLYGAPLSGADRVTVGHRITASSPATAVVTSPLYGGRKVLRFEPSQAAIAYAAGTCPRSYTVLLAADLDVTRIGTTSSLFTVRTPSPSNSKGNFRWNSTVGQYAFEEDYDRTDEHRLPAASAPAAGTPAIWAISYDADTHTSRISIGSPDIGSIHVHTNVPDPVTSSDQFLIGALNFNSGVNANWVGHIGRVMLFDRNYHAPAYSSLLAREMAALREYYSL